MLSDEEREALEILELYFGENSALNITKYVNIVLNLIEKQSKEIEHQIEKRANQRQELAILNAKQIEFNKLVNTVNSYKGQFKRQQKEIEELTNEVMEKELIIDGMKEDRRIAVEEIQEQYFVSKEESEQKEKKAYIDGTNIADKLCNMKWKDKIKTKIEEIEKDKYISNSDFIEFAEYARDYAKKKVQSLLEKE